MHSRRVLFASLVVLSFTAGSSFAQTPSALYTWDGTGDVRGWGKNFGANTVTLENGTAGQLTITETGTPGADIAISDGANRVRERSAAAAGGLDVTGLDFLEFDLGHSGASPINVQFFVQGSTGYTYVALGPDIPVTPGLSTYQLPLSGLTPEQAVYLRTVGFNARAHEAVGNVTWTLGEVRAGGTPLTERRLITHDTGTAEGGLQGAIVNFDGASVQGNAGQNQSGLSHNPAGSGSLQWTDVAGGPGGAISWGNGTAWNGNSFNNRLADLSNYDTVTVRMSATDAANAGGTLPLQYFFQTNNFSMFQVAGNLTLPIDGLFHDITFPIDTLVDMDLVDQHGINLGTHANTLTINVDGITFNVIPEPASGTVLGVALAGCLGLKRRARRTL